MTKKIFMAVTALVLLVGCSSWKPEGEKQSGFVSYSSNKDYYPTPDSNRLPSSEADKAKFHCPDSHATKFMSYSGSKDFFPHPEHEGEYLHCK